MLLVIDNVVNVSQANTVIVTGPRMNWSALSGDLAANGPHAFDAMLSPYGPHDPFAVVPLSSSAGDLPTVARAKALMGLSGEFTAAWPDGDPDLSYPAMQGGILVTAPSEIDGLPGYASGVTVWIVPPPPAQVTLTRIDAFTYAATSTTPGIPIGGGTSVTGLNTPVGPEDPNPPGPSGLKFSTWAIPNAITTIPVEDDAWKTFTSSAATFGPPVPPAVLAPPATQVILLHKSMDSTNRDWLQIADGPPYVQAVPSPPMVHYDLIVGDKALPMFRGTTDFSGAEVAFEDAQAAKHVADGVAVLARDVGVIMECVLRSVDWDIPGVDDALNVFLDLTDENAPPIPGSLSPLPTSPIPIPLPD